MTLSTSTGQLSGTPTRAGLFSFKVKATDKNKSTLRAASYTFVLPVGLALSPGSPLATIPVGIPYSNAFTASGGNKGDTYTFSETGALPSGMSLSSSGQLTSPAGPTQAGSYSFTVTASDSNNPNLSRSQQYTLDVGLQLSPAAGTLPPATVNTQYDQRLIASGGSGTYTFTAGTPLGLPPGIGIVQDPNDASHWSLSGMPSTAGTYTFSITATDASNANLTVTQNYTLVVGALTITGPAALPDATVDVSYPSQSFTASGGTAPYTFSIGSWQNNLGQSGTGSFDGLTMSSSGQLTGQPSAAGQYAFTVDVQDSSGTPNTGSQVFTLVVFPPPPSPAPTSAGPLILSPSSLPSGPVGSAYSQTITASGGSAGDTYAFSESGALPPGMNFQSTGQLTGTPTVPGTYNFTVVATDNNNSSLTGNQEYTLTVTNNGVATTFAEPTTNGTDQTLPSLTITVASTSEFTGTGQLVIQTTSGTALVSYTGMTATTFTGCMGGSGTVLANFLVSQYAPTSPISLSPTILPAGTVGLSYEGYNQSASSYYITATGGGGIYTYSATGLSALGISLSPSSGLLSGKPQMAGTFAFTVTANDGGLTTSQQYSLTILPKASAPSPDRYSPQQIRQAYGINDIILSGGILGDGAGQTIAILDSGDDPYFVSSTTASTTITRGVSWTTGNIGTVDVASTAGFAPSGTVLMQTTAGTIVVSYTGLATTGTAAFLGCTTSDASGTLSTASGDNAVGFDASDLHQFDSYFGIPDPPSFLKLDGYGGTNYPAPDPTDASETAQDVEWAHALAPGANIILFEGPGELQTALNYPGVTVISNSSTGGASLAASYLAPPGENVTFVSAAGDNNGKKPPPGSPYPANFPYVLAAGMTELLTDSAGNYVGEAGNALANWGTGNADQPPYQQNIVNAISTKLRTTPDVSFDGEATSTANSGTAEYDSFDLKINGGSFTAAWTVANGTSLATPAWAALIAIADEGLALDNNQSALNGPTGTLPDLYNLPASDFNKVTYLDNGSVSNGSTNYNQSGLGTPIANRLIPGLVGGTDTISGTVTDATGAGLAGFTVYLATNGNGQHPGEASTTTDANGNYSFLVAPGSNYQVRVAPPPSWTQTSANPAAISFTAGADNVVGGVDFSMTEVRPLSVQPLALTLVGNTIVGTYLVRYNGPMVAGTFELTFPTVPAGVSIIGQSEYQGTLQTGQQLLLQVDFTTSSAPYLDLLCKARNSAGVVLYPAELLEIATT
jgi:hypothetical protein